MRIEYLKEKELNKINSLLLDYKFNNYRNYRIFNNEQRLKSLFGEISDSLKEDAYIVVARNKDEIIGLISLTKLFWDTAHFGLKMAKIGYLIAKGSYYDSITTKNELLSFILRLCKKEEIKHLSCKADTSDYSTAHCLEEKGFKLMDTTVTYIYTQKHSIPDLKNLYHIRKFKKNDLSSLIIIAKENFWINRFYIDPHIPKNRTAQLYIEWVKNCCKGELADEVLIAEKKGKVVGFFTYKLDERLKRFMGVKCAGRGIAAVSPEAKGAYVSLLKAAIERGELITKLDLGEFETQVWNYPVIKIFQRFGMNYVNSKHAFHKWIGSPK